MLTRRRVLGYSALLSQTRLLPTEAAQAQTPLRLAVIGNTYHYGSELQIIADRFRFTLLSMLHTRIAYPKAGPKPAAPRDETLRPDVMAATRKPETAPPVSAA